MMPNPEFYLCLSFEMNGIRRGHVTNYLDEIHLRLLDVPLQKRATKRLRVLLARANLQPGGCLK